MSTKAFFPRAKLPLVNAQNNWFSVRSVANDTQCLDSFNTGTTVGNPIGIWTCSPQSNQRFEIYPTQDGQSGLRPKTSAELSVGHAADRSALAVPGTSASSWRIEQVTTTTYQLVNADSGLCLGTASRAQSPLAACDGSTAQQFTLARDILTCSITDTSMVFNFKTPLQNRAYTVQNKLGNGAWTDVHTQTTLTVSSFTIPRSAFGGNGTLDLRVVDSKGNVLYSGMTAITIPAAIACGAGFA